MPKCDACSKEINKGEMKVVPGSKVSYLSRVGFVPSQCGGPLAALSGISKEQIWTTSVNKYPTADWGFCQSCFYELEAYETKLEAREREEAKCLSTMESSSVAKKKPMSDLKAGCLGPIIFIIGILILVSLYQVIVAMLK